MSRQEHPTTTRVRDQRATPQRARSSHIEDLSPNERWERRKRHTGRITQVTDGRMYIGNAGGS